LIEITILRFARHPLTFHPQHGTDGLSNISETHPHFDAPRLAEGEEHAHLDLSRKHASEVILDCLKKEEPGSVTIIALGPRKSAPSS
jgi:inosine-uridine nucleoside N-ribohydrolase